MPQARSSGSGGSSSSGSSGRSQTKRSTGTRSTGARTTGSSSSSGASKRSTSKRSTGASKRSAASGTRSRSTASGSTRSGRGAASRGPGATAAQAAAAAEPRVEAVAQRIRKLNERIIDAGKEAGETTLSSYEKALKAIAASLERGPGRSDVEWISSLATSQAKFIREVTDAWTSAARGMLK
jgi:hypothetical protein